MLTIITSQTPDVTPAVNIPEKTFPFPAVELLEITRYEINVNPSATVVFRNFRDVDGSSAEYAPKNRTRTIKDLYAWIATQPNAAEIVGALNTLLTAVISYDETLRQQEANPNP